MASTVTVDVENQVILDPGTPQERNLTAAAQECLACARTYPQCRSPRPGADCPVFLPDLALEVVVRRYPRS
jgi:hypothetical protein